MLFCFINKFPLIFQQKPGAFRASGASKVSIGESAWATRSVVDVRYPVKHGVVTNWDDMEQILHYIFNDELRISPKDLRVLLTEPSLNPKINREKLVEIMFETFGASGVHIANQALLSLYCSGLTTGLILDCGFGLTQAVPVLDNNVVQDGIVTSDLAGSDLTLHMANMLSQLGGFSSSSKDLLEDADELKKKYCYVAQNFSQELQDIAEISCSLPDGKLIDSIKLGRERIKCPEGLFKPDLMGSNGYGIHELIHQSISKCGEDHQAILYENIILAGGSTMFPGIRERVAMEIKALAAPATKVKVIAPPERKYSCWIGGSILGSVDSFGSMLVTKEEYQESGPSVVHQKCL